MDEQATMGSLYWVMWALNNFLPQLILVNGQFRNYLFCDSCSKFVKIENIPTYFIIFQAFLIFLFSIGPIKTIKMVLKFPAYLITPMFSFWTMGLVSKNLFCCCFCCFDCSDTAKKYHYNRRLIGVSFWYTWINAGISFGIAIGRKID